MEWNGDVLLQILDVVAFLLITPEITNSETIKSVFRNLDRVLWCVSMALLVFSLIAVEITWRFKALAIQLPVILFILGSLLFFALSKLFGKKHFVPAATRWLDNRAIIPALIFWIGNPRHRRILFIIGLCLFLTARGLAILHDFVGDYAPHSTVP